MANDPTVVQGKVDIYGRDGWDAAHYMALIPAMVDQRPEEGWPVLLVLQGTGQLGRDWKSQFSFFHEKALENFVIITPFAPNWHSPVLREEESAWGVRVSRFNEDATMYLFEHALHELFQVYGQGFVDLGRICITGYSLGGEATWNIAARFGQFFAAAAPMACCGSDDAIYTAQGAWNLSMLPLRAYQTATERYHYKANANVEFAGRCAGWQREPCVRHDTISGLSVRVAAYGDAVTELWEIQRWEDGEEVDTRALKNHDVWSIVLGDEDGYGLFSWLLQARNPCECRLTGFSFIMKLQRPLACCPKPDCPGQRTGIWTAINPQSEGEVVGAFPEWQETRQLQSWIVEKVRTGRCNEIPRVGDRVVSIDELTWQVERSFGFHVMNGPQLVQCEQYDEPGIGWRTESGEQFYCVRCWSQCDRRIRSQCSEQEIAWKRQMGAFSWVVSRQGAAVHIDTEEIEGVHATQIACYRTSATNMKEQWLQNPAMLRCSCTEAIVAAFNSLHGEILRKTQPLCTIQDLRGVVLNWRHNGKDINGTVTLCEDGTVQWNGGQKHGFWCGACDGKILELKFGTHFVGVSRMRLEHGGRLVMEKPVRHPATIALPQDRGLTLFKEQQQRLAEIAELKSHDPRQALMELRHLSDSLHQNEEHLATWKDRICTYLRGQEGPCDISRINSDLRLSARAEVVSKRKLSLFPRDFLLSLDGKRQTIVQVADPTKKGRRCCTNVKKMLAHRIMSFLLPRECWSFWSCNATHRELITQVRKTVLALICTTAPWGRHRGGKKKRRISSKPLCLEDGCLVA
eukprot:gnl/TRDRNA2_/TRDRNA2_186725_c0_seq1.p1 gnl/TRDRNA2_/TRDRNA2_186725_c0~~gnl/TRDRNA2_/TRDRNA2_186725_c0_seq1.p1  ORF type:complete len:830 (-),score=123.94 gnl/TRDRNA2_/TRDRNA2_186725_c0_seq1:199-2598(-)